MLRHRRKRAQGSRQRSKRHHGQPKGMLALALGLMMLGAACGPPPVVVPLVDPNPGRPELLTANAILAASAQLKPRFERGISALQLADLQRSVDDILFAIDPEGREILAAAAQLAYADGRLDDGLALFSIAQERGFDDAATRAIHAEALVDLQQYALAREIAYDGLDQSPDDLALRAAADRAFDEDPLYGSKVAREITDRDLDAIKALGGGSTLTFKFVKDGANIAAFKPNQDLGQSMFRSEIAYYRLCALLRCSFRVPENQEVRLEKADFDEIYARVDSPKQRGYKGKFSHLTWTADGGADYIHGTQKEWVPAFTGFPIEASLTWTHWLRAGADLESEGMVVDWLPTLARSAGERGWHGHSKRETYLEGLSITQLAQQMADLLAMDFLANNWDRFSGDVSLWGANCHVEPGGIVAIDNGAAFPPWHTKRVWRRLRLTQRFSRSFVNALRRLEYDPTLERLFPSANKDETKRFDIFWERRTELLEYVDTLVEDYGEEAVYAW